MEKIENHQTRKKLFALSAMGSRSREVRSYASTTASPPTIQISLDDSVDTEYKESNYVHSGGLISPGTDFSEQVRASHLNICICV